MIRTVVKSTLVGMLMLVISGCEYIPIAGGALDGETALVPDDWTAVAPVEIIQLETRGDDGPYSVNLWVVEVGGTLHVFAGDNRSAWVVNIEHDPRVRLGVDGSIYELKAERVRSPEAFSAFAAAWEGKYGNRPRNEDVGQTYLYRLLPRPEPVMAGD